MGDVRINELPSLGPTDLLTGDDRVPMWHAQTDRTVWVDLATLRIFMLSGGEAVPLPPVVNGESLMATVTEVEEGTQRFDIPDIAGKSFVLRRRGAGAMIPGIEYNALSSGGFQLLKPGDLLQDEEVFEVDVFTLAGPTNAGSGGSFINGVFPVAANVVLHAGHLNKLIQLRGGNNNQLLLTLPSLVDVPENSIWPIESLISNNRQHHIQTQGGQSIYFAGTSSDHLWIGLGESIHLMAGSDGWYPISFSGNFFNVGEIVYGYKVGLNQVKLDGSHVGRALYPRLWEWALGLGESLVTEQTWGIAGVQMQNPTRMVAYPFIGCFSTGDLSGNFFRLPNFTGSFIRTLGAGADRYDNRPGSHQDDMYRKKDLTVIARANDDAGSGFLVGGGNNGGNSNNNDGSFIVDNGGGLETRPENIGLHAFIRC